MKYATAVSSTVVPGLVDEDLVDIDWDAVVLICIS